MKDPILLREIVFGAIAALLLLAMIAVFGHPPRLTEPKMNCICPESSVIVQPRSLEIKPRN